MRSALQFALVNFISLTANVATFAWVFMLSRSISLGAILAFLLGAIINFVGYRFIFTGKSRHE